MPAGGSPSPRGGREGFISLPPEDQTRPFAGGRAEPYEVALAWSRSGQGPPSLMVDFCLMVRLFELSKCFLLVTEENAFQGNACLVPDIRR